MGFGSFGSNVLISERAAVYGAARISIGSNVRIDDFCVISAGVKGISLGSYVHIGCHASLIGKEAIAIGDYAGLSSRVAVYSSSDDYSGEFMSNPTVPEEFKKVDHRPVTINKHCLVGAGTVILPGVTLGEGCAVGALSLVMRDCEPFGIYIGVPVRMLRIRSRKLLELEKAFVERKLRANY
jgi:galactoside O-acetyltransferase